MALVISDIIRVPERKSNRIKFDINNQINYWKLYEQSFKEQNQQIDIEKSNLDINLIPSFVDYIENIKYNFHCKGYDEFEYIILKSFLTNLNTEKQEDIFKLSQEIFNLDKKNISILKVYFSCIDKIIYLEKNISEKEKSNYVFNNTIIKNVSDSLCNLINEVDLSKVESIIKINLQLDKYLDIVPDSFKSYLSNELFEKAFCSKLKKCFELDFDKMLKILQQWKSISEKIVLASSIRMTECLLNGINYEHKQEEYTNSDLAKKTFYIFGLINKYKEKINEEQVNTEKNCFSCCRVLYNEINTKNENFIKYLFASVYDVMKDNSSLVLDFIRFQKHNYNKLDFINYYKIYLQKRLINGCNIEKESIFYKEVQNVFTDDELFKYIDVIDNCIKDFKISNHINNEVRSLSVVIKNPVFKNVNLDLYKIKLTILSSVLWNNFIQPQKSYKINIPNNIKVYTSLIEKYYDKKYENRSINISHEESVITIMLRKLQLKLPLSNYYLLKYVANKKNFENKPDNENNIKFLSQQLNIPSDEVEEKINAMLFLKIIVPSSVGYDINLDMCNSKNKIDMTKKIAIKEPEQVEEIDFCKEDLIDCFLVKIVKKEPVSYGKYLYQLRSNLKNMFIPNDQMIKERIDRMIKLEYIRFEDEKYHYIS